jgi:hypothetical protein
MALKKKRPRQCRPHHFWQGQIPSSRSRIPQASRLTPRPRHTRPAQSRRQSRSHRRIGPVNRPAIGQSLDLIARQRLIFEQSLGDDMQLVFLRLEQFNRPLIALIDQRLDLAIDQLVGLIRAKDALARPSFWSSYCSGPSLSLMPHLVTMLRASEVAY